MVGRDERLLELAARNDPASRVLRSPAHREFCRQLFFPRSTASLFFVERIRRSPGRVPPARGPVLEQSMSSRRRNSVGQIEQFARRTNYWPGFVHQPGHSLDSARSSLGQVRAIAGLRQRFRDRRIDWHRSGRHFRTDRKSTRLNSSHITISYAVFCLKKKRMKPNFVGLLGSRGTFEVPSKLIEIADMLMLS